VTNEEREVLVRLFFQERGQARRYAKNREELKETRPGEEDIQECMAALIQIHQENANALWAALKILGAQGMPEVPT